MDTSKLINRIIAKYEDSPEVQADIKKVLALVATENRYFFRQFSHNEQRPAHSQNTRTINQLTEQLN